MYDEAYLSINDQFEHIYCINLARRPDRWVKCEAEFAKHGIKDVEQFVATDGHIELPEGKLKPGERGITNSMMRVFQDAIEKNYANILVLDDDVEFADDTLESLQWTPEDWEILHFGGNHMWGTPQRINAKLAIPNKTLSSFAIAFQRRVFKPLLDLLNYEEQLDVTYAHNYHQFKSYVFVPPIAWVKPDWSDIQDKFTDHVALRRQS